MPNGGTKHCHSCNHLINKNCSIRLVEISKPHWTVCDNWNDNSTEADGEIFAIVCEVIDGAGGYENIPYFNGNRVDTFQEGENDSVIKFDDGNGNIIELPDVDSYLKYNSENKE